ncbi:TonB-dependent siderophore receptor [Termitidicoccus mucosus]|uniref:TonB-dependent receptor n=1 Tax=Termitidicoccus mucosus TaxID=1184151 RepID=A0A178ICQ1_9BACT|nr:hypothetical protein AW736_20675 [Opitutaceae bacterium TSB47]
MKSVIRIRPVSQLGILLAALLTSGLPAAAQSTAASGSGGSASHDAEVVALDRLTVKGDRLFSELFVADRSLAGTKTSTPLVETSQSLTVIGRNEMDARGVQRLTDAVSYVAGVQAEFQGIDSRVDTLKVRGFEAGGFASNTYLDNLRAPSGGQWTRAQFDLFGLERVEVLKGPSAVLYGQVAPGGLVNLVSKRPGVAVKDSVELQVGSYDTIQATLDVSGALTSSNRLLYRVAGLFRDGDAEVDHTELQRIFVAPSLTWKITDKASLTFLTQYQKDNGGSTYQFLPQTGTLKPGDHGYIDPSTFLGEPTWNNFDRDQHAAGYAFDYVFNDTFTLRQNFRYSHVKTDYKGIVGGTGDATPAGDYTRRSAWGYGETDGIAVDTHLQSKFATGGVKHTVLTGFDFLYSDWEHTRLIGTAPSINIYNPVYSGISFSANPAQSFLQDTIERQIGFYLQEQASFGGFRATLGLRRDEYDVNQTISYRNGTVRKVDIKPDSVTWRAGLLYLFDNGLAPYASYATSFDSAPYSSTDASGQPLREPTEGGQYEAGLKYKPAAFDALLTLSLFQLTETNRVMADPGGVGSVQVGEVRIRGIEFEGKISLVKNLDAIATWTRLDPEITKNSASPSAPPKGNAPSAVPEDMASLWLSYVFSSGPLDGLTAGAGVRYVGESYGNDANTIKVPGYTLVDAAISYDLGKKFPALKGAALRLSATNLADKRYVATSTAPSAAWYGSGRNVSLSVRYNW